MSSKNEDVCFPLDLERFSILLSEYPHTQSKLAKMIGISDSELSKWKNGERQISKGAFERLCKVTLCNPLWLLGLSHNRAPDLSWRQLDIADESAKLSEMSQVSLLSMLLAINEQKGQEVIDMAYQLFLASVKKDCEN